MKYILNVKWFLKKILETVGIRKKISTDRPFIQKEGTELKVRSYANYDDYLEHQAAKLSQKYQQIKAYDLQYEEVIFERYRSEFDFEGKTILCLAARLGGEVRAFKRMGALAIGVDIEPGPNNTDVHYGDFHELPYPNNVFDYAFCNAIDHVLNLDIFFSEVKRILKPGGVLIAELGIENPSKFEVIDTSDHDPIIKIARNFFEIEKVGEVHNKIEFVDWKGNIYSMVK